MCGRLTVGMAIGCTLTTLFDALAAFHRTHPGVEISLLEDSSERLVGRACQHRRPASYFQI